MLVKTTKFGLSVLLRLVILVGGALLALVGSDLIHLKVILSYNPWTISFIYLSWKAPKMFQYFYIYVAGFWCSCNPCDGVHSWNSLAQTRVGGLQSCH